VQPVAAAACVTVNVLPAIAIVAVRGLLVVLAATVKLTVPEPVPPLVFNEIQDALVLACQAHPLPAVTVIPPIPPAVPNA
jgi:hypothetical protein